MKEILHNTKKEQQLPALISGMFMLIAILLITVIPAYAASQTIDGVTYYDYGEYWGVTGSETGITAVTIPDEIDGKPVSHISGKAFQSRTALVSVEIPGTAESIVSEAFYGCTSLTKAELQKTAKPLP